MELIIWQQHYDHQLVMIFQNVINRLITAQYIKQGNFFLMGSALTKAEGLETECLSVLMDRHCMS